MVQERMRKEKGTLSFVLREVGETAWLAEMAGSCPTKNNADALANAGMKLVDTPVIVVCELL
jgi:hypothetical protein